MTNLGERSCVKQLLDFGLQRQIDGRVDGEMEPIELVEVADVEQAQQSRAHRIGGLLFGEWRRRRERSPRQKADRGGDRGVGERGVDDAVARQQAGVLVDLLLEGITCLEQIRARCAQGDEQGEGMLVGARLGGRDARPP